MKFVVRRGDDLSVREKVCVHIIAWCLTVFVAGLAIGQTAPAAPPLDDADALRIENAQLQILFLEERVARLKAERDRLIDGLAHKAKLDPKRWRPDVGSKTWRQLEPPK